MWSNLRLRPGVIEEVVSGLAYHHFEICPSAGQKKDWEWARRVFEQHSECYHFDYSHKGISGNGGLPSEVYRGCGDHAEAEMIIENILVELSGSSYCT